MPRCHSDEVYRHGHSSSQHERFQLSGCHPKTLLLDAGYFHDEVIAEAQKHGLFIMRRKTCIFARLMTGYVMSVQSNRPKKAVGIGPIFCLTGYLGVGAFSAQRFSGSQSGIYLARYSL
ncbi:IS1 family transposase [Photorhabdus asymbiotica UENP]